MAVKTSYRTHAQEELLNYLKAAPGKHYTVEEIKNHFIAEQKPIGTATIYRRLEKFIEEGCVRRYVLGPGESACYAFVESPKCASHFHCKCEVCGKLIHMGCNELRGIQAHLLEQHGFFLNAGKTVFYGICEQCRDR